MTISYLLHLFCG